MISVIIPAHNEERVIARLLEALTDGHAPGELEIIVVCNGCSDDTASVARGFGAPVQVIETDVASKVHAINLGDAAAHGFPRVYSDADVVMSLASVRDLAQALSGGRWLAAAPRVETLFLPGTAWSVRAYYRFWMALPFVQEGMMAAGVYAVSEAGRKRWDILPDVIADDGYFRLLFGSDERTEVQTALSSVRAPAAFADLIRIKTRSRLGVAQLHARFPELYAREKRTKRYGRALWAIARQPGLYPCAFPFLVVSVISRLRARQQARRAEGYLWERDRSSRGEPPSGDASAAPARRRA
jgi:glycosyltransferase involved in cell wall biosynthesis